jgi:hypothetical protein
MRCCPSKRRCAASSHPLRVVVSAASVQGRAKCKPYAGAARGCSLPVIQALVSRPKHLDTLSTHGWCRMAFPRTQSGVATDHSYINDDSALGARFLRANTTITAHTFLHDAHPSFLQHYIPACSLTSPLELQQSRPVLYCAALLHTGMRCLSTAVMMHTGMFDYR